MPALFDTALLAALATVLVRVAERQRVHRAARRDLQTAARLLEHHPLVRENPTAQRPVSRRRAAATAPTGPGSTPSVRPSAARRPARPVPPQQPQRGRGR